MKSWQALCLLLLISLLAGGKVLKFDIAEGEQEDSSDYNPADDIVDEPEEQEEWGGLEEGGEQGEEGQAHQEVFEGDVEDMTEEEPSEEELSEDDPEGNDPIGYQGDEGIDYHRETDLAYLKEHGLETLVACNNFVDTVIAGHPRVYELLELTQYNREKTLQKMLVQLTLYCVDRMPKSLVTTINEQFYVDIDDSQINNLALFNETLFTTLGVNIDVTDQEEAAMAEMTELYQKHDLEYMSYHSKLGEGLLLHYAHIPPIEVEGGHPYKQDL